MGNALTAHVLTLTLTCPPLSERVACSKHITFPYVIDTITVHFPPGCEHFVLARIFLSPDSETPTTGIPTGTNLQTFLSQTPWISGDDEAILLGMAISVRDKGSFLKLHLENDDAFAHTITATITLTARPEE